MIPIFHPQAPLEVTQEKRRERLIFMHQCKITDAGQENNKTDHRRNIVTFFSINYITGNASPSVH